MKKIWILIAMLVVVVTGCTAPSYQADGVEAYDIQAIVEENEGDLDSCLAIFPDGETVAGAKAEYSATLRTGLFDTDGEIVLECTYDKKVYQQELKRIGELSVTIVDGEKSHTNTVLYDEASYDYPAYITIDGFDHTYEYALLDKENQRIVYVYLAYPSDRTEIDEAYLKRDSSLYDTTDTLERFSMYNHSFDGGESWIEFSD